MKPDYAEFLAAKAQARPGVVVTVFEATTR
jgi:hypothetical protein